MTVVIIVIDTISLTKAFRKIIRITIINASVAEKIRDSTLSKKSVRNNMIQPTEMECEVFMLTLQCLFIHLSYLRADGPMNLASQQNLKTERAFDLLIP